MKTCGLKTIVLAIAALGVLPGAARAVELHFNNIDDDLAGPGRPTGFYEFHGDAGVVFSEEVTATDGVGGTQSYRQTIDSTDAATSFYFYSGFGQFAVFADDTNLLAGGVAGSDNPARYRFSADVKVEGNNGSAATMPLSIRVAAIDGDYETQHGIDVNNDTVLEGGAAVYTPVVDPVITTSGEYVNVSFTMDQGVQDVDPDVLPEHRVFSNNLSLLWQVNWHQGGFGFDAGNMVSIDNVRIEFLDVVAVAGDYNLNGTVDAADYVVWRDMENQTGTGLAADGTGPTLDGIPDGVVDVNDYNFWKANFGNPGAGLGAVALVPEPGTLSLLAIAAVIFAARFTNRWSGCVSARNC